MDINIQKNQGIISSIKTELNSQGYDVSSANISIWTEVMKQVQAQNEQNKTEGKQALYTGRNNLYGDGHKNFIVKEGIISLSKTIWDNICKFFKKKGSVEVQQTQSTNENSTVSSTAGVESKNPNLTLDQNAQRHKEVVEKSVSYIEKYFDASGLGNHFKTEEDKHLFLQCLKEVVYDKEKNGAGHAEAGIIHIETNNEKCNNLAEMTKLLIHEANHAFLERKSEQKGTLNFPTKAEETECETLALTTMSYFVKNFDEMEDYEIYGKKISEFNDENTVKNDEGFKNWLNGYQQLADNLSGDITIQHSLNPDKHSASGQINIKSGDIIRIEGEQDRTIGQDAYLEGCDDTAVTQLIMHKNYYNTPENERTPDTFGNLIFNDLPATAEELKQVFKTENSDFAKIPFSVLRKNPQTGSLEEVYKGYKYIPKS